MATPELPSAAFARGPEPDEAGRGSSGGEGQKPAEFGQASDTPDWGVPGEAAGDFGGLTGAAHPQPTFLPDVPFVGPKPTLRDVLQSPAISITKDTSRFQDVKPIAGGASDRPTEDENPNEEPRYQPGAISSGSWTFDVKGHLNWREDLSEGGQKLFRSLLLGEHDMDLLTKYAEMDGYNLEEAIEELDQYGILDKSEPGLLTFRMRRIS